MTAAGVRVSVVEKLHAAGVRTFVEVGPAGVLTGLTRRILEGREGVTFLQFDQRGRSPREHLARLREQLAAAGAIRGPGPTTAGAVVQVGGGNAGATPKRGRVVSFDATARRRERNRAGGAAPRGTAKPADVTGHTVTGHVEVAHAGDASPHGNGVVHREPPAPHGAAAVVQLLEPVVRAASQGEAHGERRPTAAPASAYLEDVVAGLLAEAGVEPPLVRAGGGSRGVQAFLDTAGHLFEITAADHPAILSAASRDALCDLLGRSGGKSRWLSRRPPQAEAAGPAAAEIEAFA